MQSANFEMEVYDDAQLEFSTHKKGFVQYSIIKNKENTVILFDREEKGDSSARLVTELALELKKDFPKSIPIKAENWLERVLFRYGGPMIQFESCDCFGTITFEPRKTTDTLHGKLSLTFIRPTIDKANIKKASIDFEF